MIKIESVLHFNKPFISGVSVIVESDHFIEPQKLIGLLTGILIFQKDSNTRYTLGIAIIADHSTRIPAFPIISYWHRFNDPR